MNESTNRKTVSLSSFKYLLTQLHMDLRGLI